MNAADKAVRDECKRQLARRAAEAYEAVRRLQEIQKPDRLAELQEKLNVRGGGL